MSQSPPATPQSYRAAILVIIALSTLVRIGAQVLIPGFLQGDDLEIVEEALRPLLGLDVQPWVIRHLSVPHLIVRPWIAAAQAFGVHDVQPLLLAASVPFILLSALNSFLVYRLGTKWFSPDVGTLAAALYSFHWVPLVYGTGGFPRVVSVTCVLVAALLIERSETWSSLMAGVLLGLAIAVRYSEVIFLFPFLWHLASRRRFGAVAWLLAGYAAGVMIVGWYDAITWGSPFASLRAFAHFTLVERASSSISVSQPMWWYLGRIHQWLPVPALFALCFYRGARLERLLPFTILPVFVLSAIHHKEVRYLQGVLPFVSLLLSAGLIELRTRRRELSVALSVASILWGLAPITRFEKKSSAAVLAAAHLSGSYQCVAVPQPWAFGNRLWIKGEIRDIGVRPVLPDVSAAAPGCLVVLYESETDPSISGGLTGMGCTDLGSSEFHKSRGVVMFDCTRAGAGGA